MPHDTYGLSALASSVTCLSKTAPGSLRSVFQYASSASQAAPCGIPGRVLRYAKVVSSGAIRPALEPASTDMLHSVMRASIESASIASPRYSMTWPWPPAVPTCAMKASTRSLAVTPAGQPAGHGDRHVR